jgi:TRAP-type C4-dicarboxylate transport system substrate-binding protein
MFVTARKVASRACIAAFVMLTVTSCTALAEDKSYVMKITLATVDDDVHQFAKDYAASVEKDSAGRIRAEIYPASRLGSIQRQIEGVQFGAIQVAVIPPEFFAGVDERFEILAAPGLVASMAEGQRLAANPAVRELMLGLGAGKGLHGAGLFMATPSSVISRAAIRHLADFKGKKIRIFASQFQNVALQRLGAIPKPMTLGEVLPALQDNALDGAISGLSVVAPMHFQEVAKYATETGQPAIFGIVEISKKWYDSLPADLQRIVDKAGTECSEVINPKAIEIVDKARQAWLDGGGELITLPPAEQSAMLDALSSVGEDIAKAKPELYAAYRIVSAAAQHR